MERDREPLFNEPQTSIEQGGKVAVFLIVKARGKATGKTAHTWVSHWWSFDGLKAVIAMTPD